MNLVIVCMKIGKKMQELYKKWHYLYRTEWVR